MSALFNVVKRGGACMTTGTNEDENAPSASPPAVSVDDLGTLRLHMLLRTSSTLAQSKQTQALALAALKSPNQINQPKALVCL